MKEVPLRKLLMVLMLMAVPIAAHAQFAGEVERPIVSASRLQLGGGINHEWYGSDKDGNLPSVRKEFTLGLYSAYNLVPALDLVGFAKRGLDSEVWNTALGIRVTFFAGGEH